LNYEGGQFSKSQGKGIFTEDAMQLGLEPDIWRFYLMLTRPENKDTDFTWPDFQEKINNELIANLGNFVNRVISFAKKNYGKIPRGTLGPKETALLKKVDKLSKQVDKEMYNFELKKALRTILSISDLGNKYFQSQKPWETVKTDSKKCKTTLYACSKMLGILEDKLEPFLPATSKKMQEQLKMKNVGLLFKKLDDDQITAWEKHFAGKREMKVKKMINYQDFDKLDLRVGKIASVSEIKGADKLYNMTVDFGEEKRQVIAGIKPWYKQSDLKGKKAVFIVNLEPATIRGLKSEAMILAAEQGKKVVFIGPEKDIKEGSKIS